ncbi:MAG: hypothetical protein DIJKHBIC_01504 [Thermoanaerobaculia bacterium]|nr:hypothetical protein [Thermoanaerobaculia bacterium]
MTAITSLEAGGISTGMSCIAMGMPRATVYRRRQPAARAAVAQRKRSSARALGDEERTEILRVLNSPEFADQPPAEIHAQLLDQGIRLCSVRTMYRLLSESGETRERRDVVRHPKAHPPVAFATAPNEVWAWDITKLKSSVKWVYYHLYLILDIFSRYVVGWLVAEREDAKLAKRFIAEACDRHGVSAGTLVLHSDRGSSMTSKEVSQLLADLGVSKSLSRPNVSDDNAFAEAHFKTLKYQPEFPDTFLSLDDARLFVGRFISWYNTRHAHSGIRFLTPEVVHSGRAEQILQKRQAVLDEAFRCHPERYPNGRPALRPLPDRVYLARPSSSTPESGALVAPVRPSPTPNGGPSAQPESRPSPSPPPTTSPRLDAGEHSATLQ